MEDLEMPSGIDESADVPNDEGFELVRNVHFYSSVVTKNVTAKLAGLKYGTNDMHGYEQYAKLLGEPEFRSYEFSRWTSDVEFGRQILNGVNPVVIRKCEALPAKFPVTDEMVRSSLNRGLTLQQEIEVSAHFKLIYWLLFYFQNHLVDNHFFEQIRYNISVVPTLSHSERL